MTLKNQVEQEKYTEIMDIIKDLTFGEVQITIHEGKIVQVNRTDKKRFTV